MLSFIFFVSDIFICFLENAILLQLLNYYMYPRSKLVLVIFWFLLSLLSITSNFIDIPINLFFGFLLFSLYSILNYSNPIKQKVVISTLLFSLNAIISSLLLSFMMLIDKNFLDILYTNPLLYLSLSFISKFFLILFICILNKFKCVHYSKNSWLIFISELILFFFSIFYIFVVEILKIVCVDIAILFFLLIVLLFISLLISITQYYQSKQHSLYLSYKNESLSNYVKSNIEFSNMYEKQLNWLHSIRNQTIMLRKSLEDYDVERALQILNSMSFDCQNNFIHTDNEELDYIINSKLAKLESNDCYMQLILETSLSSIRAEYSILLIGNMLDLVLSFSNNRKRSSLIVKNTPIGIKISLSFYSNCDLNTVKSSNSAKNIFFSCEQIDAIYRIAIEESLLLIVILPNKIMER